MPRRKRIKCETENCENTDVDEEKNRLVDEVVQDPHPIFRCNFCLHEDWEELQNGTLLSYDKQMARMYRHGIEKLKDEISKTTDEAELVKLRNQLEWNESRVVVLERTYT